MYFRPFSFTFNQPFSKSLQFSKSPYGLAKALQFSKRSENSVYFLKKGVLLRLFWGKGCIFSQKVIRYDI